jgi:hypothetical protein
MQKVLTGSLTVRPEFVEGLKISNFYKTWVTGVANLITLRNMHGIN